MPWLGEPVVNDCPKGGAHFMFRLKRIKRWRCAKCGLESPKNSTALPLKW